MDERKLIDYINQNIKRKINLMEVCGTHTHEIRRIGLASVLSKDINLISGPGCPICLTSTEVIDLAISLVKNNITVVTYGDMLKVNGSEHSLQDLILQGYKIKEIKSPLDLFPLIEELKKEEIVFFGVGFETTAPVLSSVIKTMKQLKINNISFLLSLKRMKPILKKILTKNNEIDGIIAPGHVAVITGSEYFKFITEEFEIPCSVCGYKEKDILSSIYFLTRHIDNPQLINLYSQVVRPLGNKKALNLIDHVFEIRDSYCRGMGNVNYSSYQLKETFKPYDAFEKYHLKFSNKTDEISGCSCQDVMLGLKKPIDCPLFQTKCDPQNPIGPCMASSEGTCLAYYKYK